MDTIDNLKKLGLKENRKYLILVVWLLLNITIIQFPIGFSVQIFGVNMDIFDLIGVVTYIPFLTFLIFIFLYSLVIKKDVKDVDSWKVLLFFFLTLPLLFFLIPIMVGIFIFSIISYVFFTSWFILYGAYLTSKRLDDNLKKRVHSSFYRGVQFFGGSILSLVLLALYVIGSSSIGPLLGVTFTQAVYDTLNYVVIFIGIVIVIFIVVGIVFMFKGVFNAWVGMFSLSVVIYTFYLFVKIFLAIKSTGGEGTSVTTQAIMLVLDLLIILYSISTLMGTQAELLSKNLGIKRVGLDSILIWLVFSKVAYEFIHNYPFQIFKGIAGIAYIDIIDVLDEAFINLSKNIGVLFFFLILLVALGFYQIKKYNLNEREFKDKVDQEVKELLSPVDFVEQVKEPLHAPDSLNELDNSELESGEEEIISPDRPENDNPEDFYSQE